MVTLPFSQINQLFPGVCWQLQVHFANIPIPRDHEFVCLMFSTSMELPGEAAAIIHGNRNVSSISLLVKTPPGAFGVTMPSEVFAETKVGSWHLLMIQAFMNAGHILLTEAQIISRIKTLADSSLE